MKELIAEAGLTGQIEVDSAGTHVGLIDQPAFSRTLEALSERGMQSTSRTRQLEYDDLNRYDYILALDRRHLSFMLRHSAGTRAEIRLLLQDARSMELIDRDEVIDPFPDGDYEEAYNTIRTGCVALLKSIRREYRL